MEKGTKLKLKRKLKDPQQNITEEINRDGTGSNARSNAHVDVEEFVVLTSESDGEEPQEKQKKTLQGIESEPEQSDRSKRHFLDVKDTELRKLRELIMKISGNPSTQKVTGFPSHLSQYIDNCDKSAEATIEEPAALDAFVQARISYEIHEPNNGTKLSPFPSMCDWCRRRKSTNQKCRKKSNDINMTNQNNDHKKSVLNGNPAQMDNDMEKDGISVSESVAVNLEQKVDTSQVLDIKPMKTASHRNKIITSKHLERDVVSNQRSSLLENNSETNNSHLMRDRNSNYYSLQSRNGNNIRASSSDRQTHTCILAVNQRSNTKNTAPTSLNKGFDNEIVDVESNIPDHRGDEMENHDVSTFNLAFDSDSEMETETEGESNMVAVHNEDMNNHKDVDEVDRLELVSKPNHLTIHDQQTFTKVRKDVIQGKQSEIVSKSKHQGPHKLQSKSSTGIKESGTRNNVDNVNHGQVEDNIPTASNTGMTNKVPIACVSPCVSSEKRIESNREIELNAVKNCPLCQMEFARSTSLIEIDGHIAACFSAADDDIVW